MLSVVLSGVEVELREIEEGIAVEQTGVVLGLGHGDAHVAVSSGELDTAGTDIVLLNSLHFGRVGGVYPSRVGVGQRINTGIVPSAFRIVGGGHEDLGGVVDIQVVKTLGILDGESLDGFAEVGLHVVVGVGVITSRLPARVEEEHVCTVYEVGHIALSGAFCRMLGGFGSVGANLSRIADETKGGVVANEGVGSSTFRDEGTTSVEEFRSLEIAGGEGRHLLLVLYLLSHSCGSVGHIQDGADRSAGIVHPSHNLVATIPVEGVVVAVICLPTDVEAGLLTFGEILHDFEGHGSFCARAELLAGSLGFGAGYIVAGEQILEIVGGVAGSFNSEEELGLIGGHVVSGGNGGEGFPIEFAVGLFFIHGGTGRATRRLEDICASSLEFHYAGHHSVVGSVESGLSLVASFLCRAFDVSHGKSGLVGVLELFECINIDLSGSSTCLKEIARARVIEQGVDVDHKVGSTREFVGFVNHPLVRVGIDAQEAGTVGTEVAVLVDIGLHFVFAEHPSFLIGRTVNLLADIG